ncbi:MAG: hypothetical protein OXH99_11810 [Bryobacterales bacterium]|nr:hypothetical protein [Bryobacterales bacterium]
MDRIAALQGMLEADASNHFVRYALAQEHVKRGDDLRAHQEFSRILRENADYQAAYYHDGKALERLGRGGEAQAIYRRGIEAALRNGDLHARDELEAALSESPA